MDFMALMISCDNIISGFLWHLLVYFREKETKICMLILSHCLKQKRVTF